ncbi:MAG: hypothetical protein E4H07_05475 [Nitrosomonadales bacterium]|nr:MAG: hypothetical protein E4H07_05475 [Nitrosomonadales bacterium]
MFGFPKSESKGYKIADECFEHGLKKGAFVKLSRMLGYIELMSLSKAVEYGFYKRINELIKSGEIMSYCFQGGEQVFVHKDYEAKFQELLPNATNDTKK